LEVLEDVQKDIEMNDGDEEISFVDSKKMLEEMKVQLSATIKEAKTSISP